MGGKTIGEPIRKWFRRILQWLSVSLLSLTTIGQAQTVPSQSISPPSTQSPIRLGPAIDPIARRSAMIGRWYGESKTSDGGTLRWITERENNGTYRTEYLLRRSQDETNDEESVELGQWGLSGSIFFTIQRAWSKDGETQRADPGNVYSYDAYELISINDRTIEYLSAGSGKRFMVRRVTPNFKLGGKRNQ